MKKINLILFLFFLKIFNVYSQSGCSWGCSYCFVGKYVTGYNVWYGYSCSTCVAGRYTDSGGANECKYCPSGFYTGNSPTRTSNTGSFNINHCHDCSETWHFVKNGACAVCSSGQSTTEQTEASCQDCAVGKFYKYGQCKDCPAGYYQTQTGKSSCSACLAGYYQVATGSEDCTSCPTGKYQEQVGQDTCETCSADKYGNEEGQTSCQSCDMNKEPYKYCQVWFKFNDLSPSLFSN